ncbi:MAG TPA: hypothetical protein P5121_28570 [Caldilineaceae bacterium]|nr:hypothetical protein [Caldilineaceae bacterium]
MRTTFGGLHRTTSTHHISTRHRSIRAAFESSWQRLSRDEQRVFAKLTVFRGGFTRAAAQAVADASLTVLAALVNKSFIRFQQATERYEIHELMRQFGAEKLVTDADLGQRRNKNIRK